MKTPLLAAVFALSCLAAGLLAGPRDAEWAKVNAALRSGEPKTILAALEPIIAAALADKAYGEAVKAIGRKAALEASLEGNRAGAAIARLEAELERAPDELKPMLKALLAHWYWKHFQQNQWRFLQRTDTTSDAASGTDIDTWSLARILAEIDRRFTDALADEARLKSISIGDYNDLLAPGSMPDAYRPTLFDFIAHEALGFYQAGEQGGVKVEDEFELDAAQSPIFAPTAEFLAWQPRSPDESSPLFKAIKLQQKILLFHRDDTDRSAFLDADLARLRLGHNKAVGEEKTARYKAALERFAEEHAQHESSARAIAALATLWHEEGEFTRAYALAQRGAAAFPNLAGGAECINLIRRIEQREAEVATERVWNAPWPTLSVAYRNITKVHFRAVRRDFAQTLSEVTWSLNSLSTSARQELLASTPTLAWSADLPATVDYKERTAELPAPTTLPPGFYFLLTSPDEDFSGAKSPVSLTHIWVSTLALVTQNLGDRTNVYGFVLDALTGEPVSGAVVRSWEQTRGGKLSLGDSVQTDHNGRFKLSRNDRRVFILAEHRGQAVANVDRMDFGWPRERAEPREGTHLFTDRQLYRPGQAIHYKGIVYRYDHEEGTHSAQIRKRVVVHFSDHGGKTIAEAEHYTNDYGSFSGTFTAPRDRLLGRMALRTVEQPGVHSGETWFRVEEYKLPKFRVELAAPATAPKLDETVTVTGRATAYTGAAIGGAKVRWRVERAVQVPRWCWWWLPESPKAIAHGAAVTAADGSFSVAFNARPDRSVPVANEPVFSYKIYADITDTTGETRSEERSVRAGYTALQASVYAAEWQTPGAPVEFQFATTALDGQPQAARGTLRIHALRQPAVVPRASLRRSIYHSGPVPLDPANPDGWELGAEAASHEFATDATGRAKTTVRLPAGVYRAVLETQDSFGRKVTARQTLRVVDPEARHYGIKEPSHLAAPKWSAQPGEVFSAWWGTGYERGQVFVEIECNEKILQQYWTTANRTQQRIQQPVTEEMRGGFTVRLTYVRENRAYLTQRVVQVPWSNQQLALKWERFRSKLQPGQPETWTVTVTGPEARRAAAEMAAGLYDAALDQIQPHEWPAGFPAFRQEQSRYGNTLANSLTGFDDIMGQWDHVPPLHVAWRYRAFPEDLGIQSGVRYFGSIGAAASAGGMVELSAFRVASDREVAVTSSAGAIASAPVSGSAQEPLTARLEMFQVTEDGVPAPSTPGPEQPAIPKPDLSKVAARKNLRETAFFFPHLLTDKNGEVKISFTMPEALTEWRFFGFAHDEKLRSGFLTATTVTAKDLMVQPNAPRFVREGDTVEFTVKVSNQSDTAQRGTVRLTFADAATLAPMDAALGNRQLEQAFDLPAKQSQSYSWRIAIPDGMGFLTYKAVGATATLSDGEEGNLPVLSRRILVAESLPLPIRGPGKRDFDFAKLSASGASPTLRHQSLTVQMVSQPAWYAVLSLPYLMEFPHECSEQLFNRLYANALARHIAKSDPKIRRIFDLWKNTPALDSPLEKNADLKSVMLEETPWLRQAQGESAARRNVGLLFDDNRLTSEIDRILAALGERQLSDGLWSWFPGGMPNEYISLYIATGFGRLRHLGVATEVAPALKALPGIETWMHERLARIQNRAAYVPGALDALYLYSRSFFLTERPLTGAAKNDTDYLLGQARKHWLKSGSRQTQAHLALTLHRLGDNAAARTILRSLKEYSTNDPELGMHWRDQELSWWWYHAPIETQALMIEAFAEVTEDTQAVEDCKVWLVKQKQTQAWKTTKATADAIYAILLRGSNLLASDALVEVALGGTPVKPERTEAGTGFYEKKFSPPEIKAALGKITVTKPDAGVSWGSVHWQYLESIDKITAHSATPLTLKKSLFIKETTTRGQQLRPVTGPVAVGDELVVRIELRTDRDMEYLHLKDQRGSGTEPVNALSRYKYQDGLRYYESTRDTATHFYIDYLPKGTYVLEYSTRVQLKGSYPTGIAEIQCMYAPEFNSHSESLPLEVR